MEKLNKEDIYINLQGKSEEELTDLYNFLESIGENIYRRLSFFLNYSECCKPNCYLSFSLNHDEMTWNNSEFENKQEVTIQQLKEILQPMENKEFDLKGYSVEVDNEEQAKQLQELAFKQGFEWYSGNKIKHLDKKFFSFNAFNQNRICYGGKYFKDEYVTKEIHFNDIFKTELTLTEQLEKAKAEVKRLEDEIEDSKIKIGDWVKRIVKQDYRIFKINDTNNLEHYNNDKIYSKITDQELINKLNNLIK